MWLWFQIPFEKKKKADKEGLKKRGRMRFGA